MQPIHPQVIVAGMPRTGTDSIKTALILLYGPGSRVYHMSEVLIPIPRIWATDDIKEVSSSISRHGRRL